MSPRKSRARSRSLGARRRRASSVEARKFQLARAGKGILTSAYADINDVGSQARALNLMNAVPEDDGEDQGGWEEVVDEQSGKPYYHHRESGKTVWERPLATLAEGWTSVSDDQSGATYYFHQDSGETSWNPPWPEDSRSPDVDVSDDVPPPIDPSLPEGWEAFEGDTGTYYYHRESEFTTWEHPNITRLTKKKKGKCFIM